MPKLCWNFEQEKKVAGGEKCRPISSTPVPGTPWCVVWTGDKRVFFYNPSNKTSVWEKPQELVGRYDVEEMIKNCPDVSKTAKVKKAEATSTTSPSSDAEKQGGDATVKESSKERKLSTGSSSDVRWVIAFTVISGLFLFLTINFCFKFQRWCG